MKLKNKRILITGGPTWVPIDNVRVISNVATGETGVILAEKLIKEGAKVTLLLGPATNRCLNKKIRVLNFRYFSDLLRLMVDEVKQRKYDVLIHSAAVSDYCLESAEKLKISSNLKRLKLVLMPTPKIIDLIKKIDSSIFLVGFKFELGISKEGLIKRALNLIRRSKLDLAVANTISGEHYESYVVDYGVVSEPYYSREKLADGLIKEIAQEL
ncbi:MAG: hypothetical protein HY761_04475 [Candidatus Omnitrophica bacterium]|nr:hypothetical protein [Candidatus Omnitrophota bacterium]